MGSSDMIKDVVTLAGRKNTDENLWQLVMGLKNSCFLFSSWSHKKLKAAFCSRALLHMMCEILEARFIIYDITWVCPKSSQGAFG